MHIFELGSWRTAVEINSLGNYTLYINYPFVLITFCTLSSTESAHFHLFSVEPGGPHGSAWRAASGQRAAGCPGLPYPHSHSRYSIFFFLFLFILLTLLCGVVYFLPGHSLIFDIIPHSVQPSSLRPSSLPSHYFHFRRYPSNA